ncbi:MAG: sigma-54-dependent transcriptional regulator [Spirochaetaceae bacterium]
MVRVLLIDRETETHRMLDALLPDHFTVTHHPEAALSVDRARRERPDIILLDIELGDADGIAVLRALMTLPQAPPVIVLTALRHTRIVVEAMRSGATDYLTKPVVLRELNSAIVGALERRIPDAAVRGCEEDPRLMRIVGDSRAAAEQRRLACLFAAADGASVILLGESGTGKDLFAQVTHALSARGEGPYVAVNCGAVPETLFESEMFGVSRGAYTDALERPGHFERAHRGTLFLDEVGELSPAAQVKLLRALEEKRVRRVGSAEEYRVDTRVIAASNRSLKEELTSGRFRGDLFYRLNVLGCELAPLRARAEDIPMLVHHFLRGFPFGPAPRFSDAALHKLQQYHWPGNIRELRNVVERACVVAGNGSVQPTDVVFV